MVLKHPGQRYLTSNGLERALAAGRNVEQWLGVRREAETRVLRWLAIEHRRDGRILVRVREVWDEGGAHLIDVYEFTSCDPENPEGVEHVFGSATEALEFATSELGADPERFVNEGIVQFEYQDSLSDLNT
jgi:hypothetical protein